MFKSGDNTLCPVIAWAHTVQRVRKIPSSTDNSPVCLFSDANNRTDMVRADHVRSRLRAIVDEIGNKILGFNKYDIGLHSIRSGGAMAMFLSGTSVIVIMRVGCWSSEAFLEYIRDQVESFTKGVSHRMLEVEEFFNLNLNNSNPSSSVSEGPTSNEDGQDIVPVSVRFNGIALNTQGQGTK